MMGTQVRAAWGIPPVPAPGHSPASAQFRHRSGCPLPLWVCVSAGMKPEDVESKCARAVLHPHPIPLPLQ